MRKKQVANIFLHQNTLAKANLSPLQATNEYNDISGKTMKADFYNDYVMLPDPAELNVEEKNLLELSESKTEGYYTRGGHNNCDTFFMSQNFIILFPQDTKILIHILMT